MKGFMRQRGASWELRAFRRRQARARHYRTQSAPNNAGYRRGLWAAGWLRNGCRLPGDLGELLQRGADLTIRDAHHNSNATGWAQACLNDNPDSQRVAELIRFI